LSYADLSAHDKAVVDRVSAKAAARRAAEAKAAQPSVVVKVAGAASGAARSAGSAVAGAAVRSANSGRVPGPSEVAGRLTLALFVGLVVLLVISQWFGEQFQLQAGSGKTVTVDPGHYIGLYSTQQLAPTGTP